VTRVTRQGACRNFTGNIRRLRVEDAMQEHGTSRLAIAEPEGRPAQQVGGLSVAGSGWGGTRTAILRAVAVLLDMLAWWPEALLAGQTCLVALQARQGDERE
jgi:hypothetical protein